MRDDEDEAGEVEEEEQYTIFNRVTSCVFLGIIVASFSPLPPGVVCGGGGGSGGKLLLSLAAL